MTQITRPEAFTAGPCFDYLLRGLAERRINRQSVDTPVLWTGSGPTEAQASTTVPAPSPVELDLPLYVWTGVRSARLCIRCVDMAKIRVDVGSRVYSLETDDPGAVVAQLRSIGFQPGRPRRRQVLVGASGVAFTTAQARAWLIAHGYDVPYSGRLADHYLHLYAEQH